MLSLMIKRVSDWLFFKRMSLELTIFECGQRKIRKKYCNKGFHKFGRCTTTFKKGSERSRKVEFLKCVHCNQKFFAKVSDREYYKNNSISAREIFSDMLKQL